MLCINVFLYLITKTYLYNFDPLKPHFYITKLGFTGVYIIFLISAQKHRLWVLVRTASPMGVLTCTYNLCFEQKYEKYYNFLSENLQFLVVKILMYLNRRVFVMFCYYSFEPQVFVGTVLPNVQYYNTEKDQRKIFSHRKGMKRIIYGHQKRLRVLHRIYHIY